MDGALASASGVEGVVAQLQQFGLVPVIRAGQAEEAFGLATALAEGGIRCLEITLTTPGAASVIERLVSSLGARALVGAGSVTSLAQARECVAAGARFLVSPGHLPGLTGLAHELGAASLSGALTPSEVMRAHAEGADFVKVFPCSALGGAAYLRALRAPLPDIRFMPTGGVDLVTLSAYVAAGACALGVGSALVDVDLYRQSGASAVTKLAASYVDGLRLARAKISEKKDKPE